MSFTTIKIAGADALRTLDEYRLRYSATSEYPFLIGDREDLELLQEAVDLNEGEPAEIIRDSLAITLADWIADRRSELEGDELTDEEIVGAWPGEPAEKSSISLHKDSLSGRIRKEVYLGLARIEEPWHLPALLKYGGWNECPEPEVHCAFHREWSERFGAEITGMSGDVIECVVKRPPTDREAAMALAWEQYWYCADIVTQGCGTVSNLAATLLNSRYWFFWWD